MSPVVTTADKMDCPMRFMGFFLVSTGIYRNQNLVPSQEPRCKGGVVPGPDGIARHFKAPCVNPGFQFRLVSKVVFLTPETGVAYCGHPAGGNLAQRDFGILRRREGFQGV